MTNILFTTLVTVVGGAMCLGILFLFVFISEWTTRRGAARNGYWVEYVSGRGEMDKFAIVYHEGEDSQLFYGHIYSSPRRMELLVPEEQLPQWLKGRRDVVVERIQRQNKHVHIVTKMHPV